MVREEPARVVAVEGARATVELERSERCAGCGLCAALSGGKMRLVLDAVDGLEPGQAVVVALDRSVSLRSVLLLFGLPLAGLVGGVLIGRWVSLPGLSKDAASALLAVILLVAAFRIALLCERRAARTLPRPTIVRIEPP